MSLGRSMYLLWLLTWKINYRPNPTAPQTSLICTKQTDRGFCQLFFPCIGWFVIGRRHTTKKFHVGPVVTKFVLVLRDRYWQYLLENAPPMSFPLKHLSPHVMHRSFGPPTTHGCDQQTHRPRNIGNKVSPRWRRDDAPADGSSTVAKIAADG